MKFQIHKGANGQFFWRLRASNGEPIASGEGYKKKTDCQQAINLVKGSSLAPVQDLTATAFSVDDIVAALKKTKVIKRTRKD